MISLLLNRGAERAWGDLTDVWDRWEVGKRQSRPTQRSKGIRATRVLVDALFANLDSGATVEQICERFPAVSEWQVWRRFRPSRKIPGGAPGR